MLTLMFFGIGIIIWNVLSAIAEETKYHNEITRIDNEFYRNKQRIDDEYYRDLERIDREFDLREQIYDLQDKLDDMEQRNWELEQKLEKKYDKKIKQTKRTCWNGNTWQEISTEVKVR